MRGLKYPQKVRRVRAESRTPQGVRGLKSRLPATPPLEVGRTPQGVRGLKYIRPAHAVCCLRVAPRKGCVD